LGRYGIDLEERSDDALCRAPAVPGILPPGKIVEGEKAAGVYEGAAPPVLKRKAPLPKGAFQVYKTNLTKDTNHFDVRCKVTAFYSENNGF
jgi:hypothetical protein